MFLNKFLNLENGSFSLKDFGLKEIIFLYFDEEMVLVIFLLLLRILDRNKGILM